MDAPSCELASETLPERHVVGELRHDQLQSDLPVERDLARAIDDAHAPLTGEPVDPVSGKNRTDLEVGPRSAPCAPVAVRFGCPTSHAVQWRHASVIACARLLLRVGAARRRGTAGTRAGDNSSDRAGELAPLSPRRRCPPERGARGRPPAQPVSLAGSREIPGSSHIEWYRDKRQDPSIAVMATSTSTSGRQHAGLSPRSAGDPRRRR